jgi:hypothetical protein
MQQLAKVGRDKRAESRMMDTDSTIYNNLVNKNGGLFFSSNAPNAPSEVVVFRQFVRHQGTIIMFHYRGLFYFAAI